MKDPKLIIAMSATLILLLLTVFRTVYKYTSLSYAKKVGHFGFIISFSVLTIIYAVKYFSTDIKIPFLLVAVILLAPFVLYQAIERKNKGE